MGRCCGALVGFSIIMTILVVVGGYFGYNYLVTAGAEYLASSIEKDTEILVNMVFEKDDQDEIMEATKALTNQISSGEISMLDLIREMTDQKKNQTDTKAYLLGFKKHHLKAGEKLTEEEASQAAKIVDQIFLAVMNDGLQSDQIASITELITYRHEEKHSRSTEHSTSWGKSKQSQDKPYESTITYVHTLLRSDLNGEQISEIMAEMQKLVEENNLPVPDESYDFPALLKQELLQTLIDIEASLKGDKS